VKENPFDNKYIAQFLKVILPEQKTIPPFLAHYTTTDGLMGIFNSNTLWYSHISFLNDTTELHYGIQVIENVFSDRKTELDDCGFNEGLQYHGRSKTIRAYLEDLFEIVFTPYIFCLCENANQLSQWREYSSTNGYSIVFKSQNLMELRPITETASTQATLLCKVIYERYEQRSVTNEIISLIIKGCNELKNDGVKPSEKRFMDFMSIAARATIDCVIKFKDYCFHEEHEWRSYRWATPYDEHLLKYCNKGDTIMPYMVMQYPRESSGLLPVTQVYYSSSTEAAVRGKVLKMFLDSKNYKHVTVYPNGFPPLR
jgi:hypothetical protein